MSDIILFNVLMFVFLMGFFFGEIFNHNKVLPHDEAPKVGKHKESKEGCTSCKHFLNTSDKCWSCGEDYKNHQPG